MIRLFVIFAIPFAILLYSPGLEAPLYLDDTNVLRSARLGFGTRSLGYASYWINDQIIPLVAPAFPWKSPFYFRLGNVLIHVLAATALFWLARELTRRWAIATAAGILFLVHPIQTQAVTYISQRFESQATLFMLLSAGAYARFRNTGWRRWLILCLACGGAAALTKETAIALPLWILVIEAVYYDWREIQKRAAALVVLVAALTVPALQAFWSGGSTFTWIPWTQYFKSQGPVLAKYLQLLVWPRELFLFYDFPPVERLSLVVILQWALVLSLLAVGFWTLKRNRTLGFGILTFFILLLPVVLLPLPDLVFEHRLYPAMAGIALSAAALLYSLNARAGIALLTVLTVALGYRTIQRNKDWLDPLQFMEMHRDRFPTEPIILVNLGAQYAPRGFVDKAIEVSRAAQQYAGRANAYYRNHVATVTAVNLGFQYLQTRNLEGARQEAERAIRLDPSGTSPLWLMGSVRIASGDNSGAVRAYKEILAREPVNMDAWSMLGQTLTDIGDQKSAEIAGRRLESLQALAVERRSERLVLPAAYSKFMIYGLVAVTLAGIFLAIQTVWKVLGPSTALVAAFLRNPRNS